MVVLSLAVLLIDEKARTYDGFKDLIVGGIWLKYGHPFGRRYAVGRPIDDEYCPLFTIFLDCVYQMLIQFPTQFEFNSQLLKRLAEGVLCGKYSDFLFNSI